MSDTAVKSSEIYIKDKFSPDGWLPISRDSALEHARWKIRTMATMNSDEERLAHINSQLKGVQFSLNDL